MMLDLQTVMRAPSGSMARELLKRWKPPAAKPWARATCQERQVISKPKSVLRQIAWDMPKISDRDKQAPLSTAAGYLIRHLATGRTLPRRRTKRDGVVARFHRRTGWRHARKSASQTCRSTRICTLCAADHFGSGLWRSAGDDPDAPDDDQQDDAQQDQEEEQDPDSQGQDDNDEEQAEADPEQSQDQQQDQAEAQISQDESADDDMSDEMEMPEGDAPLDPPPPAPISDADPNYNVLDTQFDEEIKAEELAEPAELERLRAYLDQQLEPLKGAVSRLANKLQRRLQAQQNRSWLFDLEEGILDAGRLARVVANPTTPLSFKMEKDTEFATRS